MSDSLFSECRLEGDFTLSSGRNSTVFYDFDLLRPREAADYVQRLLSQLEGVVDWDRVDFVAAPALGGIVPGFLVGFALDKPLVIIDKGNKPRGPEFRSGRYLIVDDVTTSYLAAKRVIAALPLCECKGILCYIFRGDVTKQILPTFYLSRKEVEEKDIENWRPILGLEGQYSVSDLGNVRSEDRVIIQTNDVVKRLKGRPLSILYDTQGYPQVNLGRGKRTLVHTLVLEAFISPRPSGFYARHLNGDKTDNRLENLMWDTLPNNQRDKIDHGTHNAGIAHYRSKLTEDNVRTIRNLRKQGLSYSEIASQFSITEGAIKDICYRRNWKHVE